MMEDIFKKANELGLLIREAESYKEFERLSEKIESDPPSKKLLEEFFEISEDIFERERDGDIIEAYEKEGLRELNERISGNELILEYLKAKSDYINLLQEIQKAVQDYESGEKAPF